MKQDIKAEPSLNNINVNDTIEILCDNPEQNNRCNTSSFHPPLAEGKVLQIKQNETNGQFMYYVHFVNLEKRMDKWISHSQVLRNYGRITSTIEGSNILSHTMLTDNFVLTRKRSNLYQNDSYTEKESPEMNIKVKNIEKIVIGYYEIDAWYYSPFPNQFCGNKILYICEQCLKYMKCKNALIEHRKTCSITNPPGKEVYKMPINPEHSTSNFNNRISTSVSVFEIIGAEQKLYCQNLCLIAKLFLDHKSIYFDVSPFKFFVLTENDNNGKHIVAYFSKENSKTTDFNLACIMVLPPFQRKGYGQFLISMSYFLSQKEGRICTPEIPLSDLGKISYKSYWTIQVLEALLKNKGNLCIKDISEQTGIKPEDINYTLNELSLIKYWKGQQVVQNINTRQIEEFLLKKKNSKKHHIKFDKNYYIEDV